MPASAVTLSDFLCPAVGLGVPLLIVATAMTLLTSRPVPPPADLSDEDDR